MQIHNLKISISRKKKRVGRGGKRGYTSGRGQKGQKSRAGHRIRPAGRDLILRIPKKRGYRNAPKKDKPHELDFNAVLGRIKPLVNKNGELRIDISLLKTAGVLPLKYKGDVKMLGKPNLLGNEKIFLEGIRTSKSVKAEIEKNGGKVE